jgi:hypothetical protein
VTIVAPQPGETLGDTVRIQARAVDNRGVSTVEFYSRAGQLATDSTGTGDTLFEFDWSTTSLVPGAAETLFCVAFDQAGNRDTSPFVPVVAGPGSGKHHSGIITGNVKWLASENPHIIDGNLVVDGFLTLAPGVRVYVAAGARIGVGQNEPGGLWAVGTSDSTITVTSLAPVPARGDWQAIELLPKALPESCVLRYCTVEYGGSSGKGMLYLDGCPAVIEQSVLRSSSGAAAAAKDSGFGRFAGNAVSGCGGLPVRVDADHASSIGSDNTFSGNLRDGIEVAGGIVTRSDTWPDLGVPYCITATMTVADTTNPLLVIAPGCSLLFAESAALRIGSSQRRGGLKADGTNREIVFSALTSVPVPGTWRGIEFLDRADSLRSFIRACRVEYAGAGGSAGVTCSSAPLNLTRSTIAACSGTGVSCVNTGFAGFESNTITGCGGCPIRIGAGRVADIGTGNNLTGNACDWIEVSGGSITVDARWWNHAVPYRVTGIVEVGSSARPLFFVAPGAVLEFDSAAAIQVGRDQPGAMYAVGSPDSITFTGSQAQPGAWRGVQLYPLADAASRLERCRLLYGGSAGTGILFIQGCAPVIAGNEIAYSSNWCVYLLNTELDPDSLDATNYIHSPGPGYSEFGP